MVQVDVFWSYGLASGLTLASGARGTRGTRGNGLLSEKNIWVNPYFLLILAWIALFFAPSGLYLLWAFPCWETMFLATTHRDIPAWLVTGFAITNITQGILGYWVTLYFMKKGQMALAKAQAMGSHLIMFGILFLGWDGSGFQRFTYAGTGEDWERGRAYPWTDFFSAPIFFALVGLGVFLIPTYAYLVVYLRKLKPYGVIENI